MLLAQVKKGSRVKIVGLKNQLETRSTITGIGILPGDVVEVLNSTFLGSPVAISFGDNEFVALRLAQARMVEVEEIN